MKYFLASLGILLLGFIGIFNPIRASVQSFTSPIQFGLRRSSIGVRDISKLFHNINNIREENIELLERNRELESSLIASKNLAEENKLLRQQLSLDPDKLDYTDILLADVLGNPTDLSATSVYLNKGKNNGVVAGDIVILGSYLVGVVSQVSDSKSLVTLINSSDLSVTVIDVDSKTNAEGILRGSLGTSITVTRLLAGEDINVGDTFLTSGKDGVVPAGLGIGKVKSVTEESAQSLKSAELSVPFDLTSLSKVFIIKSI